MSEQRPDPEKILKRVQDVARKEQRGRLKIYLGAAPGVGKTHEMLHDAIQERAKGRDVIVGVVESHGRKEIQALLKNIEILPKQEVDYRGKKIYEFDLDAALKRNPGLILIDEMAHSNAPGLRHTKRWQDIKELLDRGINVCTTLNVQHIESLNDDVSQIIHAPIMETVPDSMIEMADAIELVDLPPEELLIRLKEGKVYVSEQAALAAEHFFRLGNLNALRELALKITAEHVDTEVLLYRQDVGIKHVWPTRDRILVCVGPTPDSVKLVRAAKRIVSSLQASWVAVYVDTPELQSSKQRNDAIQHLHIAERLGAETHVLSGSDIVKEILNFARENNITQIMVWKHIYTRWRDFFRRNIADEIVRSSNEIDVYIMTGDKVPSKNNTEEHATKPFHWHNYIISLGAIIIATSVSCAFYPFLSSNDIIMIYVLAVMLIALLGKMGPAVVASIASVFAFDYFFFPPFFSIDLNEAQNVFTLVVMLSVTQIISYLIIKIRRQADAAHFLQHQTSALYTLSRHLSSTRGTDKLLQIGAKFIAETLDCEVSALLPINDHLTISFDTHNMPLNLDEKEKGIANWVFELGQPAGYGTDTLSFSKALFIPLLTSHGTIGVLRIEPKGEQLLTPDQMRFLEACANQIALALDVDRMHMATN